MAHDDGVAFKSHDPLLMAPSNVLKQLDPDDLRHLLVIGRVRHYGRGEFIFSAGDPSDSVYFLRAGQIKVFQVTAEGRQVILWFCFEGEVFGLAEVVHGGGSSRVLTAQACDDCVVLCVPRKEFNAYAEGHGRAALIILRVLACRARVLGDMLVNLVNDDVNTRITKLILRLSACYGVRIGQEIHLNIRMTHQEIADMVGSSRQTVTKILGQLQGNGLLSIRNRRIRIQGPELPPF
ncbi:Crp/Fnr family transcriptional regulator [Acidiferrobacter thiooxydans]|uniref:Crp/Fnr family transcriptional regulator n=1 Tax=Acidiferrobacter thiooxydans TaxID=163359 RepID=UPI00085710BA|nr:Crp/Fnr family transcriptional regulator [Acidiferrobacter thiooxydans]UEO01274.1 Crp/Fnr family transcriptional regulator [Acidiferrobacter thiooxydans]